jgi:polysaccharide export outer membrane protein
LDAIAAGKQEDIALVPGDRIVVLQPPDLRKNYVVNITGEVQYPGSYPITLDRTRLSEVLRLAGGFTERASLQGSELLRSSVDPKELYIERLLSARGSVSPEDSANYALESELRILKERVTVDFAKLFLRGDSSQDVVVRPYDRIVVPTVRKSIFVFGQVVSPGNVTFVPGESFDSYVGLAGGFTDKAREGDVMIIKRTTRQWLDPSETEIEEGDYVWVPKEPERSFGYYMSIIGQTASVVSVAVSVVLLTIQLGK